VDDFLLASETIIGRGVTNDIVLPDRTISTRHARLCNDGDGYRLEALSEGYETSINGIALAVRQPTSLHDGDLISLGSLLLRFESAAE
jgi:pSer/pThr/pTyr-binding forkhead associated (FHA) protein